MELITNLENLKNQDLFNKEEVLKIVDQDTLLFYIREKFLSQKANYSSLYSVFDEIREILIESKDFNIFNEFLILETNYLNLVYGIEVVVIEALIHITSPVYTDYILATDFLSQDKFYGFYLDRYNSFKQNNELSIMKMFNSLDVNLLGQEGDKILAVAKQLGVEIDLDK